MSDALSIETPEPATQPSRRTRASRSAREIVRDEPVVEQTQVVADTDDVDAALTETRQKLEEATNRANEERRRTREAEQQRQVAEQRLQQARVGQANDRQTVVAAALEAASADIERARTAKRMARDAGDWEGETKAEEDFATAVYRRSQAAGELEYLKSQPKPEAQQQQRQTPRIDELSQRWLDEHPRYFADESYRNTCAAGDLAARRAGHNSDPNGDGTGNPEYIKFVDAFVSRAYAGAQNGGQEQVSQSNGSGNGRSAASGALPPSRGSGGPSNAGYRTVETLLGPLQVRFDARGNPANIKFANKDQLDNFEEGAKLNSRLYAKDPQAALADYAKEHVMEAIEGFENFKVGEGKVYGRE